MVGAVGSRPALTRQLWAARASASAQAGIASKLHVSVQFSFAVRQSADASSLTSSLFWLSSSARFLERSCALFTRS
jgi:hypothetical protein